MKKALSVVVASMSVLLALAGPAAADPENQRFIVISAGPPGAPRTVIAAGTFNSIGTEVIESNPPGVSTARWVFPEGTLFVTNTYTSQNQLDPATCVRTITLQGTWQITNATGALAGTTGGGTFYGPNRIFLNRTPGGDCVPPPIFWCRSFSLRAT